MRSRSISQWIVFFQKAAIRPAPNAEINLHDIDFQVVRGSINFIIGPVGSGKSTLLKAILGEAHCASGSVQTNCTDMSFCSQAAWLQNTVVRKAICGVASEDGFDGKWYRADLQRGLMLLLRHLRSHRLHRQTIQYTCLGFGLPMILLGVGLLIHFRFAGTGIGWIVMCQIFIAFGGGTLVIGEDMAVMAASERGEVPMMSSLIGLCSRLGGAVGYAASAAIFANVFEGTLRGELKEELVERLYKGGYVRQEGFPVGGVVRMAVEKAYAEYMKWACVAAVVALGLGIPCVLV